MKPNFRWKEPSGEVKASSKPGDQDSDKSMKKVKECRKPTLGPVSPVDSGEELVKENQNDWRNIVGDATLLKIRTRKNRFLARFRVYWKPEWRISLGLMLLVFILSKSTTVASGGDSDVAQNIIDDGDPFDFVTYDDDGDSVQFVGRRLSSIMDIDADAVTETSSDSVLESLEEAVEKSSEVPPCATNEKRQRVKIQYTSSIVENEYIVAFKGYYRQEARERFIQAALNESNVVRWELVPRDNPASDYPSDFDVVQIQEHHKNGGLDSLKDHPAVKRVTAQRMVIRHLHFINDTEESDEEIWDNVVFANITQSGEEMLLFNLTQSDLRKEHVENGTHSDDDTEEIEVDYDGLSDVENNLEEESPLCEGDDCKHDDDDDTTWTASRPLRRSSLTLVRNFFKCSFVNLLLFYVIYFS
ncbi:uncharacterized protein [Palaemon carinicauda]|uniref:uncharacterized protein n=1 Tax=Palaemon carinicauda TaxID=392227 RepID=UPI0035B59677